MGSLFRDMRVLSVALLHIFRAIVFVGVALAILDMFMVIIWATLIEAFAALWLWSMRMEAWGIGMGIALVHLLLPFTLDIAFIAFVAVTAASVLEIIMLVLMRHRGYYSFVVMAISEPDYVPETSAVEKRMLDLLVFGQLIKALLVFLGIWGISTAVGIFDPIPWIPFIPQIPFALFLGLLNVGCVYGLLWGYDWGFHLTTIMACLGFIETVVAWSPMVILISIWIITLLMPCWAKNEFYRRLKNRLNS
jgi:hypothetical protein